MHHASNITWIPKWVKGHQDVQRQYSELDTWAKLNIAMDELAKHHWTTLNTHRPAPFSLPPSNEVWSVWSQGQRVTKWDKPTMDQLYYNPAALTYWDQKFAHFEELDFPAICLAYKSLSLYYQLRVPKWIGRRLPVGSRIVTWNPTTSSHCPHCGSANESNLHGLTCEHPGAIALKTTWLNNLELWLVREYTHPDLRFGIISVLKACSQSLPWNPPASSDPHIRNAFRQQQRLGTDNIPFGWWANGWAEAQHQYLASISRRTTVFASDEGTSQKCCSPPLFRPLL